MVGASMSSGTYTAFKMVDIKWLQLCDTGYESLTLMRKLSALWSWWSWHCCTYSSPAGTENFWKNLRMWLLQIIKPWATIRMNPAWVALYQPYCSPALSWSLMVCIFCAAKLGLCSHFCQDSNLCGALKCSTMSHRFTVNSKWEIISKNRKWKLAFGIQRSHYGLGYYRNISLCWRSIETKILFYFFSDLSAYAVYGDSVVAECVISLHM